MFSKFELTNKGVELLNRVIAEQKTLKFTKFQIGKGDFSGDKKTLTQLVSKIDEFNVSQTNVLADGITNIKGFYDNRNLSVASKLTEIGIMAQLGDDSLTEVLFSYSNQSSAEAETIPAKESYFSRTFSVMNRTDNVTSVTFDLTIRQDKYNFGTVAEMKAADYLDVGDKVTLWGNAALGDSPLTLYIITDQVQPIQLNNKLYAKEYFKIVNDLTTGGADKALSGEMGKKLNEDKQDKTDNELKTESKKIVGAINEVNLDKGLLGKFGTTIGDFIKKVPYNCVLYISRGSGATSENLGLPEGAYSYGNLHVSYAGSSATLLYVPDQEKSIYIYNELGFKTSEYSSKDFIQEVGPKWRRILTDMDNLFLGNAGISKVVFIQDAGQKLINQGYIDKNTGKLYRARETNYDVNVTDKFELATNVENSKMFDIVTNSNGTALIFKNKMAIQFGYVVTKDSVNNITLPKSYRDTNYSINMSYDVSSISDQDNLTQTNITKRSSTGFTSETYKSYVTGFSWTTVGYIA